MLTIGAFARLGQVSPRMLRHYDEIGLLTPASVDGANGYRGYEVAQLGRLHRLLALRDLGFTLEEMRPLLDDEVAVEELRGMLRLRQADATQRVADEQARLQRVEAHLRALEGSFAMFSLDVAVKETDAVRVAYKKGTADGFGHENIRPVFERIVPDLVDHVGWPPPGMLVAWYDISDDGPIVHIGFDVGDTDVNGLDVEVLPSTLVASVLHRGRFDKLDATYEGLIRWIEDSDVRMSGLSRELYREWSFLVGEENAVTEIQFPVTRRAAAPSAVGSR